jgi:hypothetical protein
MNRLVLLVVLSLVAMGCGSGGDGETDATDPATSGTGFAVVGPLEAEVGSVPRFEWTEVGGAVGYRVAVLGPSGPIWAWEGKDTHVNLGGLAGDRPELMPGPVVVPGTTWSVVALGASGEILGIAGPIEIAPADPSTSQPSTTTTSGEVAASDLPDPCVLITQDAVDALFGGNGPVGEAGEVVGSGGTTGGRMCQWSPGISLLSVTIYVRPSFLIPIDRCVWCEPIQDLGDEAWGGETDLGSGGATLAISINGVGVQAEDFGHGITLDQLRDLVRPILVALS